MMTMYPQGSFEYHAWYNKLYYVQTYERALVSVFARFQCKCSHYLFKMPTSVLGVIKLGEMNRHFLGKLVVSWSLTLEVIQVQNVVSIGGGDHQQ